MIEVTNFNGSHIERAQKLALDNYRMEQGQNPSLPQVDAVPGLTCYAGNGLGVSAFDHGEMIGFLCCTAPFQHAFRSTDAVGVFSPMGANGAIGENRGEIYQRMYQAAGEKWANTGASSHAVCLYAHDKEVQDAFFRYGFGIRCIDAIRGLDPITARPCEEYEFKELGFDEILGILPLDHMLDKHMAASPVFILRPSDTETPFLERAGSSGARFFAAVKDGRPAAFLKAEKDGETFLCGMPGYLHLTGAFCLPEHRGKGVYQNLLNFAVSQFRKEGVTSLGVDFESINPTADRFWSKYFQAYTHGVVRRIDEHAIGRIQDKS